MLSCVKTLTAPKQPLAGRSRDRTRLDSKILYGNVRFLSWNFQVGSETCFGVPPIQGPSAVCTRLKLDFRALIRRENQEDCYRHVNSPKPCRQVQSCPDGKGFYPATNRKLSTDVLGRLSRMTVLRYKVIGSSARLPCLVVSPVFYFNRLTSSQ